MVYAEAIGLFVVFSQRKPHLAMMLGHSNCDAALIVLARHLCYSYYALNCLVASLSRLTSRQPALDLFLSAYRRGESPVGYCPSPSAQSPRKFAATVGSTRFPGMVRCTGDAWRKATAPLQRDNLILRDAVINASTCSLKAAADGALRVGAYSQSGL